MERLTSTGGDVLTKHRRREEPLPRTLRELRHAGGWSLTFAASSAGLVPGRLSELERGLRWPSRDELIALGYLYGVELECGFVVRERA